MSEAPHRWIRLDVGWNESDWLADLSMGARLGWVLLLGMVKRDGIGGSVKAPTMKGAARRWGVPESAVVELLGAASAGDEPALMASGGTWTVTNWDAYQKPDRTNAERKRKHRERTGTHRNAVPRHATQTLTLTETLKESTAAVGSVEKSEPTYTVSGLAMEANEVLGMRTWWQNELDPRFNEAKVFIRRHWDGPGRDLAMAYAAIHGLRILVDRGDIEWLADKKNRPIDGLAVFKKRAVLPGPDGTQLRGLEDAAVEAYYRQGDEPVRKARTNGPTPVSGTVLDITKRFGVPGS